MDHGISLKLPIQDKIYATDVERGFYNYYFSARAQKQCLQSNIQPKISKARWPVATSLK